MNQLRPVPKPVKPARDRAYMGWVAQLKCVCCGRFGVQVHHAIHGRFSQSRASDRDTIPLCRDHHDLLHRQPNIWRGRYGEDTDYIGQTQEAVEKLKAATIGGRS